MPGCKTVGVVHGYDLGHTASIGSQVRIHGTRCASTLGAKRLSKAKARYSLDS